jgi:ssDNA-binding Zn-finger/Zn-ribbon topoisomerase 1/RecB family exonuclease
MEKKLHSFSFSGISKFKSCPRAFEYRYYQEIPEAFTSIEGHMGTAVHAALEWAYRERLECREPRMNEAYHYYRTAFYDPTELDHTKTVKSGSTIVDYFEQGRACLSYFFSRLFPHDRSTTLMLETKFEIPLNPEINLKGVIDRVARGEDDVIRIIDYKTGKAPHPLDNLQLPSYALYVFDTTEKNEILLSIEDLKEQRTMTAPFHRENAAEIRFKLLRDITEILETTEFKANPSILCLWCGFNNICENPHESVRGIPVEPPTSSLSVDSRINNNPLDKSKTTEVEPEACCPLCGGNLVQRNGKFGPFMGCSEFPRCRYTYDPVTGSTGGKGRRIDPDTEGKDICPECGSLLKERKGRYGTFIGCTAYPQCRFTRQSSPQK